MNICPEQMNALKLHRLICQQYALCSSAATHHSEDEPKRKENNHWVLAYNEMTQHISLINKNVPFIPLYTEETNENEVGELRFDQYDDEQKQTLVHVLAKLKQTFSIQQQDIDEIQDHIIFTAFE